MRRFLSSVCLLSACAAAPRPAVRSYRATEFRAAVPRPEPTVCGLPSTSWSGMLAAEDRAAAAGTCVSLCGGRFVACPAVEE